MKLKSLLLGSAAVMVAVSGARAADAIIVEPEPVEYVRVCDAYGAGWWYIPGTETCIKFDGDVRVEYRETSYHDDTDAHQARYRARLNVRANNETEYGTLASRMRFTTNRFAGGESAPTADPFSAATDSNIGAVYVDWAVISLAGFRVGLADNYWTTAGSYGFYNARHDGYYDYTQALFLDYTWAGGGWTATVGVETQYMGFMPTGSISGTPGQPDVYAGITYSGGGWYLAGIYYYDSSASAGAWKFRADYDFGNGFAVGGWYMSDDGDTDYVHGHAWGVTAQMTLADNWTLFGGYSDYSDTTPSPLYLTQRTWTVGLKWDIVPGLYIQPEYNAWWAENEVDNGSNGGRYNIRLVRSF